jgi:LuxR family transcriptional regulator, maltose regulon positive regulatory protein
MPPVAARGAPRGAAGTLAVDRGDAVACRGLRHPHDDLLLRVAPPRVPRHLLVRPRLAAEEPRWRDAPVRLVQAPAGFGKTSLLAQWRREHLAHGTVVAWFTASERDDPARLLRGLTLALRAGAGRPTFGHTLLEGASGGLAGLEGITAWLAELAHSALDTVLVVDFKPE